MSDFDVEGFQKAARAAGHSEKEIADVVAKETGQPVTGISNTVDLATQKNPILGMSPVQMGEAGLAGYGAYKLGEKVLGANGDVANKVNNIANSGNSSTPVQNAASIVSPLSQHEQDMQAELLAKAKLQTQLLQQKLLNEQNKVKPRITGAVGGAVTPADAASNVLPMDTTAKSTVEPTSNKSVESLSTPINDAPAQAAQVKATTVPVTPVASATTPESLSQTINKQSAVTDTLTPKPVITGEAGASVSPPTVKERAAKTQITYPDTPQTWQKLTKEGTTFMPGYGPGDNNLFNTYGAEGRKAILEKFNEGKPIGSYENYQALNKVLAKGVPSGEATSLMSRLPAAEEAGNFGKLGKALKIGGAAGLGLGLANIANASTLSEAGGRTAETISGALPPVFQAGIYSGGTNVGEQEQIDYLKRMEAAKRKGAGNRGAAYDPRKFYTSMDIGVPPPNR